MSYDDNCERYAAGLEPLPLDLDTVDAGEVVEGILSQYAECIMYDTRALFLLRSLCEDAAHLLGHPRVAGGLYDAALSVLRREVAAC